MLSVLILRVFFGSCELCNYYVKATRERTGTWIARRICFFPLILSQILYLSFGSLEALLLRGLWLDSFAKNASPVFKMAAIFESVSRWFVFFQHVQR